MSMPVTRVVKHTRDGTSLVPSICGGSMLSLREMGGTHESELPSGDDVR